MDLGITGRKALLCASSAGLGLACATSLAREGVVVFINGRDEGRLRDAQSAIQEAGGQRCEIIAADITTDAGREKLLLRCPEPDILVTNNAGPPPGSLEDWDTPAWASALQTHLITPALLIRSLIPGMTARKFGRIVNITSAMVKSPRPHMGLSTAPRAALTALSKAVSLDVAKHNVTLNNLLPERIDTGRQAFMIQRMATRDKIPTDEARRRISDSLAAKRFGLPSEFGDACAFLCSQQAGFISGQNIQIDGGSYPGLI